MRMQVIHKVVVGPRVSAIHQWGPHLLGRQHGTIGGTTRKLINNSTYSHPKKRIGVVANKGCWPALDIVHLICGPRHYGSWAGPPPALYVCDTNV
jgi:hypothetical protein